MIQPDQLIALGLNYHRAGDLAQAEAVYWQVLAADPQNADVWCVLGMVQRAVGRLDDAEISLRQALELRPEAVEARVNLGNVFTSRQDWAGAITEYRRALQLQPRSADAHANLGVALRGQGLLEPAIAAYRQAIELRPDHPPTHANLADALRAAGRLAEAVAAVRRALQLQPGMSLAHLDLADVLARMNSPQQPGPAQPAPAAVRSAMPADAAAQIHAAEADFAAGNFAAARLGFEQAIRLDGRSAAAQAGLGTCLVRLGEADAAISALGRSLELAPGQAEVLTQLGRAYMLRQDWVEASRQYRLALECQPDYADAHVSLGVALRRQGLLDEAATCYRQAIRLRPDYAHAHNNLANVLKAQGKLAESVACYEQALRLVPDYPDAHKNLAMVRLTLGDFARGWPEFEWRWRCEEFVEPRYPFPRWDGSPLAGRTILLHPEQGLGDTLQFIRYARLLRRQGARVVLACPAPLCRLMALQADVDQLVELGHDAPICDFYAPLLSLPSILGTTLPTVPAEVPYLRADAGLVAAWHRDLPAAGRLRIGIAWQGSPTYNHDRWRSIPLAQFAGLATLEGVQLISLQKGFGAEQAAGARFPLIELGDRLDDTAGPLMDTAAIMQNLDLVVTSDTSIAHLAGALGVPVWVALPFVADWRWLLEREDSPWYPTMRLFRQPALGDWPAVFRQIVAAARELRPIRG